MDDSLNTIRHGDCIAGLQELDAGSVDLVFADPPFNIGYDYDVYEDSVGYEQYLDWSQQWIAAVHRALKPDGTFWLAIGDEYAAELKIASQKIGFHCRSWVIWYYTFGVNCAKKFSRSHAHLFHFVKDPQNFTFRDDDHRNRIPSARQLVYNDKRANPRGRLPDDTWIIRPADMLGEVTPDDEMWGLSHLPPSDADNTWTLRPQDLADCFQSREDTWYFPRVAGTFKERAGFHGCQMPEQLLGRIIRTCSHDDDLVVDPFSGSATTLAVAKKLGRRFLGFELSAEYVKHGLKRLESIQPGDRLDGAEEPLASAPRTGELAAKTKRQTAAKAPTRPKKAQPADPPPISDTDAVAVDRLCAAFAACHEGFSADRVVADPGLNERFAAACAAAGLPGEPRQWNALLFRLRKAGKLAHIPTTRHTTISWRECDHYLFAAEIALQRMLNDRRATGLDGMLCDPALAAQFDQFARDMAPLEDLPSFAYRWAALKLRKQAKTARHRAEQLPRLPRLSKKLSISDLNVDDLPESSGVYVLKDGRRGTIYVGETLDLKTRLELQFGRASALEVWTEFASRLTIQLSPTPTPIAPSEVLAWQSSLAQSCDPRPALNFHELCAAS